MKNTIRDIILEKENICTIILKRESLYDTMIQITNFLDQTYNNIPNSQRYWHFRRNKFNIEYCICGRPAKWNNKKKKYVACSQKCLSQKRSNTNIKLYGNKMAVHGMKQKKKTEQTNIKLYGDTHHMKTNNKEKYRQTCLKNHGVDHISKTESFKEKYRQTCLKNHGVDHISKTESFKEKMSIFSNNHHLKRFINDIPDGYEFIGYNKVITLRHNYCGNIFNLNRITYNQRKNIRNVSVCPHCNPLYSYSESHVEKEFGNMIEKEFGNIIRNTKQIISPYELDIYIPELKLAFEFNGDYWHSSQFKDKNYHKLKTNLCGEKNIRLIHIWGHIYNENKDNIIRIIRNYVYPIKSIKSIFLDDNDARKYFNINHINGFSVSDVYIKNGNSSMSFKKYENYWRISRTCGTFNDRILDDFINDYSPDKLVIDVNTDFDILNPYLDYGFIIEKHGFDYWYVNGFNILLKGTNKEYTNGYCKCFNSGYHRLMFIII